MRSLRAKQKATVLFCGFKRCAIQSADSKRGSGARRGAERAKHSDAEQSAREWGAERDTATRESEDKSAGAAFRGERGAMPFGGCAVQLVGRGGAMPETRKE